MAGDMNLLKVAAISVLTIFLPGCGLLPRTHPDKYTVSSSNHTLQELCDFPKQFFTTRYNATKLEASVTATRPLTEKIGTGNGCSYQTPERDYLGYVFLSRIVEDSTYSTEENFPARVITVDGVAVSEIVEPVPAPLDPSTTLPSFMLTASIDGWKGELGFEQGDEKGTQAGAPVLVNMIRALKGS
jgi:hypothetical protein